jgi:glycosyltransferase involved in cell wall biosynthesis
MVILANSLYPETFEDLRREYSGLLPQGSFLPYSHQAIDITKLDKDPNFEVSATIVRHAYEMVSPDVILYPSVFEGWGERGVVPLPQNGFPNALCAAIVYDFIPYRFSERFLDPDPFFKESYFRRLEGYKDFDLLLAISESTRQDAIKILNFSPEKVINISGAANSIFKKKEYAPEQVDSLFSRLNIRKPFIFYTGNVEYHKNMEKMLHAFSKLPPEIKKNYQIVLTHTGDERLFRTKLRSMEFTDDDIVITGHISDEELVMLYNLCKLFIFPSLYEGFGLPIMEAMACGAPVIASNNSSIPEVMGRADAMFDASSEVSITEALYHALTDDAFRQDLAAYGLERVKLFSWKKSAQTVWDSINTAITEKNIHRESQLYSGSRPHIAFVSPLPPQKSGISDYSADLLPYLQKEMDIDLFVEPGIKISDPRLRSKFKIFPWTELLDRRDDYATVVYQMGNSEYHAHMIKLIKEFPGVVVLHDFYLSHLIYHLCGTNYVGFENKDFCTELGKDHGLRAMIDFIQNGSDHALWNWSLNWQILKYAQEIVVHSPYQLELLQRYYGLGWTPKPNVIKPLRQPIITHDNRLRIDSREKLGIDKEDFLFCSFGFINSIKLSHLIVQAFNNVFSNQSRAVLAFVGELDKGEYGHELEKIIEESNLDNRIRITGYVDNQTYRQYLSSADIAIQLRTNSRGETSAAVLDTMAYGIPTIINSHGSLNDYNPEAVVKLPESPEATDLSDAMLNLYRDENLRKRIGIGAIHEITENHDPELIAKNYETIVSRAMQADERFLFAPLVKSALKNNISTDGLQKAANYAAANMNLRCQPRILIDVTNISFIDLRTGIQRAVKNIIRELISISNLSVHIELVRIEDNKLLQSLRFSERLFNLPINSLGKETPLVIQPGDYLYMLDTSWNLFDQYIPIFDLIRKNGGRIFTQVYDIIPIRFPGTTDVNTPTVFRKWIRIAIQESDVLICNSKSVADEVKSYIEEEKILLLHSLDLSFVHHGSDIPPVNQQEELIRDQVQQMIEKKEGHLFVMVGTIEPRKGHNFALDAFEQLWQEGENDQLCIIGKVGWNVKKIEERIKNHPELGKRLFFIENATDAELNLCYTNATALISASIAEGFGLPIIEAAFHKIPAIVSDIPVFHEVGGDGSLFFSLESPKHLADTVQIMAKLTPEERLAMAKKIKTPSWKESAGMILDVLQNKRVYKTITFEADN